MTAVSATVAASPIGYPYTPVEMAGNATFSSRCLPASASDARYDEKSSAGAASWRASVSTQVLPTNPSSSCSILKIKLVTRLATELHIVSNIRIPSRLYSTLGSIWA